MKSPIYFSHLLNQDAEGLFIAIFEHSPKCKMSIHQFG